MAIIPLSSDAVFSIQLYTIHTSWRIQRVWNIAEIPYPKKDHRLPAILSQEEVAQLIDAASTAFHRTLLMTLHATGARNAEVTRLKFSDVDSKRMVIHIQGGKGRKDRDDRRNGRGGPGKSQTLGFRRKRCQCSRSSSSNLGLSITSHRYENRLAGVPASRPARGPPERCASSHAAALFCDASPRGWCGPAHHSNPVRS